MRDPRWWTEGLPEDVIDPAVIDGPPCMAVRRLMDWTFAALEKPKIADETDQKGEGECHEKQRETISE